MSLDLNLSDIEFLNEAPLNMKKPDGSQTGWIWRMAGPGHPASVAAEDRLSKHFLERSKDQETARANGQRWTAEGETSETIRGRQIEYIIGRTLGWNEDMTLNGSPFPFTAENARTILANRSVDIYEQANDFLRGERAFTKGSPKP